MLIGFPDSRSQAKALAAELAMPYQEIDVHHFPDGESKLTLPEKLEPHVFVYRSLDYPNDKLVELFFVAKALRNGGVSELILIAPYLCYMRQDTAFRPGEVVSQKIIGSLLAELFDGVITVDPHLHRISQLEEAVPVKFAIAVSTAGAFGQYLQEFADRPILIGPDEESAQWVKSIAAEDDIEFGVASKRRWGDRQVSIELPTLKLSGRDIVLVDDIASTGHTLATAARGLLKKGCRSVSVLVTHALFTGDALTLLRNSGIVDIGSSDSVSHETNVISLAPILAKAINELKY